MREQADISASALYSTIPLLPELEASFSALVGSCGELGMEGLRRAMLATDSLDDGAGGISVVGDLASALRHDPSLHYETDTLQLSDTADLCRLSQLRLQSTSDPILHDRHLGGDDRDTHEADVMYTELTNHYREFSPGSTGDYGLEPELSDSSSSESGLESHNSAVQWDPIAECRISIDPDGPLPPVSDIFAHRLHKEDYSDMYTHRPYPLFIKTERQDSEGDESMDSLSPSPPSTSSSPLSKQPSPLLSYTTLHPHPHYLPATVTPTQTPTSTTTTTTNNSNYHDYTTSTPRGEGERERLEWMEESSVRSGSSPRGGRESSGSEGEKGQRKKPGRKKGQVSKVLHLWEFIRDLLSDPNYCPRIISWENETEGVFRVLHSSEVARLWGEKKKNKKTMTYEKLSRSLRYSRKEGYFDTLPRDRGYPKKLCFKFGPKSHGWREYKH